MFLKEILWCIVLLLLLYRRCNKLTKVKDLIGFDSPFFGMEQNRKFSAHVTHLMHAQKLFLSVPFLSKESFL